MIAPSNHGVHLVQPHKSHSAHFLSHQGEQVRPAQPSWHRPSSIGRVSDLIPLPSQGRRLRPSGRGMAVLQVCTIMRASLPNGAGRCLLEKSLGPALVSLVSTIFSRVRGEEELPQNPTGSVDQPKRAWMEWNCQSPVFRTSHGSHHSLGGRDG